MQTATGQGPGKGVVAPGLPPGPPPDKPPPRFEKNSLPPEVKPEDDKGIESVRWIAIVVAGGALVLALVVGAVVVLWILIRQMQRPKPAQGTDP
jgi:hypothetical protein